MIRDLRKRFILVTMSILAIFLVVILILLNFLFTVLGNQQNTSLLQQVCRNSFFSDPATVDYVDSKEKDHQLTELINGEQESNPIFVATITGEREIDQVTLLVGSESYEIPEITQELLEDIYSASRSYGKIGNLFYAINKRMDTDVLAVMDVSGSNESSMIHRLWWLSLCIGGVFLVLLYPICVFLSRFVTKSAEKSFAQQKQFISDAGHELKTPLSIISVNANVLSTQVEPNKHLTYIQSEVERMNTLITQLLTLARMEDTHPSDKPLPFSLSDLLYQVALPFEGLAFERNIAYEIEIADNVNYTGHASQIRQVSAILLDNAFKYTHGQVKFSLRQSGQHRYIEVYNTGEPISEADLSHIFERFYRCDKARTAANGYGLGLAIAKQIVDGHKGSITAENKGTDGVLLRVVL